MKETTSKLNRSGNELNKLLILEEADGLPVATQTIIKKFFSVKKYKTNYIITCNDISEILKNFSSGYHIIRFKKLTIENLVDNFIRVLEKEQIYYDLETLYKIAFYSHGDMRIGLNYLQSISNVYEEIKEEYFFKILDLRNPLKERNFFDFCLKKDFFIVLEILDDILDEGYTFDQIKMFFVEILRNINCYESKISEILMEKLHKEIQIDKDINNTNPCQVYGFFANVIKLIKEFHKI